MNFKNRIVISLWLLYYWVLIKYDDRYSLYNVNKIKVVNLLIFLVKVFFCDLCLWKIILGCIYNVINSIFSLKNNCF